MKEAAYKALAAWCPLTWKDVVMASVPSRGAVNVRGEPLVRRPELRLASSARAGPLSGVHDPALLVSVTHDGDYTAAVVVATARDVPLPEAAADSVQHR